MFSLRSDRQLHSMAPSDSVLMLPTPSHPQQRSLLSSNKESVVFRKKLVLLRPAVFCRSGKLLSAHSLFDARPNDNIVTVLPVFMV